MLDTLLIQFEFINFNWEDIILKRLMARVLAVLGLLSFTSASTACFIFLLDEPKLEFDFE